MSVRLQSRAPAWAREDIVTSRAARQALGIAVFALATALGAKVAIALPGTPVPFTLQTICVLLAGSVLGARLRAALQAAYQALGAAGGSLDQALLIGVGPFLIFDVVKVVLALLIGSQIRPRALELF